MTEEIEEPINNRIALIDGDIICYQLAFANKDWPTEYCLAEVDEFVEDVMKTSGSYAYAMCLTGNNNFRKKVAVTKPYKGNRKTEKPEHYPAIKQHLLEAHGASVVDNCEADDTLGFHQTGGMYRRDAVEHETVICTVDKDLLMIPGLHYNWRQGSEVIDVSEEDANKFFFTQWLTGDSVDNIPGLHRVGIKTAEKLLADVVTVPEMYEVVKAAYESREHTEAYMDEQADLLWIQRHEMLSYKDFLRANGVELAENDDES